MVDCVLRGFLLGCLTAGVFGLISGPSPLDAAIIHQQAPLDEVVHHRAASLLSDPRSHDKLHSAREQTNNLSHGHQQHRHVSERCLEDAFRSADAGGVDGEGPGDASVCSECAALSPAFTGFLVGLTTLPGVWYRPRPKPVRSALRHGRLPQTIWCSVVRVMGCSQARQRCR